MVIGFHSKKCYVCLQSQQFSSWKAWIPSWIPSFIPSGKRMFTVCELENHHLVRRLINCEWVNPLFLWPFSIALFVCLPEGIHSYIYCMYHHCISPLFLPWIKPKISQTNWILCNGRWHTGGSQSMFRRHIQYVTCIYIYVYIYVCVI